MLIFLFYVKNRTYLFVNEKKKGAEERLKMSKTVERQKMSKTVERFKMSRTVDNGLA